MIILSQNQLFCALKKIRAITKLGLLTPYYGYDRKLFPNLGGVRGEVGTGWKNVPVVLGKQESGPFYSVYNV